MNIFDIIGPVMVGPSSSHTAGAVRIGYISGKLLGEPVKKAAILLYGSFLATGKGHGTQKALVAGLLGMVPDDIRIPDSLKIAAQKGIEITFGTAQLREAHPNSAQIYLTGETGRTLEVIGESIGGGDQPGHVTEVTAMLAKARINIATMQLYRSARGGDAVMVLECDQEVPEQIVHRLEQLSGIKKVTYLSLV